MEYDKEFEEWWSTITVNNGLKKRAAYLAWQAARKDHYRIGEKVEAQQIGAQWKKGTVMAVVYSNNNYYIEEPELVRRIPSKSRIDEIAEEASEKYLSYYGGRFEGAKERLIGEVKSAILKDREERLTDDNQ